jgi:pseudaminic acid biosynthesis-associated methylase
MKTKQLKVWTGNFGKEYTDRNTQTVSGLDRDYKEELGVSATALFKGGLYGLSITSVLEVGCNIGNKLVILNSLGYGNLTGVEPQLYAIKRGEKLHPFISYKQGTVFELPFPDNQFDLVFTSDVLIHISPRYLTKALKEIVRVSKRFILGFEFYSDKPQEVAYRLFHDLMWRRNYKQDYLNVFPNLSIVYEKKFDHQEQVVKSRGLKSEMFVLKKN